MDSNQREYVLTGLQPAAFVHSAIFPLNFLLMCQVKVGRDVKGVLPPFKGTNKKKEKSLNVLIAQLVEHRAENSGVVGSNPT